MKEQNTSDEYLNSFVDNQLDPGERVIAFNTISKNEALRQRVCELQNLKELVKYAYVQEPEHNKGRTHNRLRWKSYMQPLAACLLLLLGGLSGWLGHSWTTGDKNGANFIQAVQRGDVNTSSARKIIVHVSNANPAKLKAALNETENLLHSYKQSGQALQIELIANKQGADLLRAHVSTYQNRIAGLQQQYPNLHFLVCGQTIANLRENGQSTELLPHTGIASSAAEQIDKRLLQGWGYVKI